MEQVSKKYHSPNNEKSKRRINHKEDKMISANEKKDQDKDKTKVIDPLQRNGSSGAKSTLPPSPDRNKEEGENPEIEPEKNFSSTLKEMFVNATEKGEKLMKSGAAAVGDFTVQTANHAKLKLEIHHLHNNLEKLYQESGQKLWRLQKEGKLSDIKAAFAEDFKRMAETEETLRKKEARVEEKAEAPSTEKP